MPSERIQDRRVEQSKAKVLAETYRQLAQSGIGGVSIDEVARGSGVSKTTIYRHWPSRSALLIDACSHLGAVPEAPDTGRFEVDARAQMAGLAEQLQAERWSSVYPSIIDAAERDEDIRTMQAALHDAFMSPFRALVERGKARGDLGPDRTTDEVVALLVGPLFYRRWFSRDDIDDRFVEAIIASVIAR